MDAPTWQDWALGAATVAIIVPIVSMAAVWVAKRIGNWIANALSRSFAGVVLDVMAPDMAHLGTKVSTSLDDLRKSNTNDHVQTTRRLVEVETELAELNVRVAGLERIAGRSPAARTRSTDGGTQGGQVP